MIKKLNLSKGNIYAIVLLISMIAVYYYRNSKKPEEYSISGSTMGTTYHIKYLSSDKNDLKDAIDSLLIDFNNVFSTYIPESEISTFNKTGLHAFKSKMFWVCLEKSKEVYNVSEGAFDPTVMPFVNAWGFGFKNYSNVDSSFIDSLKQYVGFEKIVFTADTLRCTTPGTMLDLSAISKGYGVDIVANYLLKKGIKNYMVEIGGEVVCMGNNKSGTPWVIGIEHPLKEQGNVMASVPLRNLAMATSGNYRNYYEKDGKKYAHTIHPKTGFPAENDLLSASVFAPDCMTADAFATAFMVLGKDKSIALAKAQGLKIFLIYTDNEGNLQTYTSEGLGIQK